MSKAFTSDELARMQAAQSDHMMDTCRLGTKTESQSTSGHVSASFSYGAGVACGFSPKGSKVAERPDGSPVFSDASLRLPLGTAVTATDRVKLTHRFGVALSPEEEWDVAGEPARGPSGVVVPLNKVEA
jgi:hypothetical protein